MPPIIHYHCQTTSGLLYFSGENLEVMKCDKFGKVEMFNLEEIKINRNVIEFLTDYL